MGRLLVIPLALIVMLTGALAWSGGGASQRVDFRFINRGDIITLDPNQMSYVQDIRMAYAMWEGLYTYDSRTYMPVPGTASGCDISADKRVYTFHLRHEARWSNGDPVTAGDFVFAWKRMLDEPGDYTYLHYYIKGAEKYVEDAAAHRPVEFKTVGVEALDPHTLRVTLNDPVTFFLDLMAFSPFLPLHAKSMEPFKEVDARTGKVTYSQHFTRPPHVVCNGPFVLKKWDFKRRLVLEKNAHYWDMAHVKSDSMEMVVCDDRLSQLMMFDSGAVDWLAEVSSDVVPELLAKGNKDLKSFVGFGTCFLTLMVKPTYLDGTPNPLVDRRLRQALAMALDRNQIVRNITRCGEAPATRFIPPEIFQSLGWRSTPGIDFDPHRAKQLLAEAGYPNGGRLPGVKYVFRSGIPLSRDLAESCARQWKQVLNLDIPLVQAEQQMIKQMLNKKDYALAASQWSGDYNDPSTFTDKYLSTSINNDAGWVNAEYDQLLKEATKEPDAQTRLRLLEKAERILNTEVPIIPIYHITSQYMYRDNLKGITPNPRLVTMFKDVEVVK
ncbi:MAG TPA: peptide ABC transporter substrate-binding protein [Tepidisphaeraceae bacterium]|jgi:oligopeptide transport system substrate-binding protein